jgi:hypothetical protein
MVGGSCPSRSRESPNGALTFASNHGLGMAIAQLDLSDWTVCCIDLPENYRCAARLASCSARRWIAASPDLNGRRDAVEVRLEHRLVL